MGGGPLALVFGLSLALIVLWVVILRKLAFVESCRRVGSARRPLSCGRMRVLLVLAFFSAPLAGCSPEAAMAGDPAAIAPEPGGPRLQAGDKLKVLVFGEDRISGEYEIDPGGDISLPLAGTVKAAGRTKAELEKALATKFRAASLLDPRVTVDIASYRPFYVLGEVQKPGDYPYRSGLNVLRAIAIAGGQTYRASETTVEIQRAGERTMKSYPLSADLPVYPGDLVRLPERYF